MLFAALRDMQWRRLGGKGLGELIGRHGITGD
jgi:hypothetical protein